MDFTPYINKNNVDSVRYGILDKKGSSPYLATIGDAISVVTDYDSFPYTRWYRGIPQSSEPVISEREAGWRMRNDPCYRINICPGNMKYPYPNHCFEAACSTVYPCFDRNSSITIKPSCVPYAP